MVINSVKMSISAFKAHLATYYKQLVKGNHKMGYKDFKYVRGIVEDGNNVIGYPCSCKAPQVEIRFNEEYPVSGFDKEGRKTIAVYCDSCGQLAHTFEFNREFAEHLNLLKASGMKSWLSTEEPYVTTANGKQVKMADIKLEAAPSEKVEVKKQIENKGDSNMMNMNFDFGMVKGDDFRLSHVGLAVKTAQGYRAYDKAKEEVIDVDILNFAVDGMIMKMPVAIKDIVSGDIVLHQGVPSIVREVGEKTIEVVNLEGSEIKNILPVKNAFGFNFYTKIVSLIDMGNLGADSDNPFGSILPFMLMGQTDGKMDMNSMLPMMLMMNGDKGMDKNMMFMMAMMGQGGTDMSNMMMMMAVTGGKLF